MGTDNVFFGAHALYYHQLASARWRIAAHAGVGFWPLSSSKQQRAIGGAGGVMALFGRNHRLVVDINVAPVADRALSLYGEELNHRLVYGLGLACGWEWMARNGFFLRADFGPALAIERARPLMHRSASVVFTGNLIALGFKLW